MSLVPWGTPKYTHHRSYYTKCHVWRYYSNRFQTNPNKRLLVDVGCASYIISHILLNPSKSHNKSVVSFRKKKTVTLPSAELLAWLLLRAPLDSHLHLIEGDPARAGWGCSPGFSRLCCDLQFQPQGRDQDEGSAIAVGISQEIPVILVEQCHKPPVVSWFLPPICGKVGDGGSYCFTYIIKA